MVPPASSAKHPGARREARRRALAEQLVGAVDELLGEGRGYQEVSVTEILDVAGVPRSTFYNVFPGKSELQLAIAEQLLEEVFGPGRELLASEESVSREQIAEAGVELGRRLEGRRHVCLAFLSGSTGHAHVAQQLDQLAEEARRQLQAQIEAHRDAGRMPAGIDPAATAAWLVAMFLNGAPQLLVAVGPARRRRNAEAMADIAWLALYGARPA